MHKSDEHIYSIINKLNDLFQEILINHFDDTNRLLKAYLICHEFAFYCLEEGLEEAHEAKIDLLKALMKAFSSRPNLILKGLTDSGEEYLGLLLEGEFKEIKHVLDTLLKEKGVSKEEALKHLLERSGATTTHSDAISKKVVHALQTLELPSDEDYYHPSESFKIAIN